MGLEFSKLFDFMSAPKLLTPEQKSSLRDGLANIGTPITHSFMSAQLVLDGLYQKSFHEHWPELVQDLLRIAVSHSAALYELEQAGKTINTRWIDILNEKIYKLKALSELT